MPWLRRPQRSAHRKAGGDIEAIETIGHAGIASAAGLLIVTTRETAAGIGAGLGEIAWATLSGGIVFAGTTTFSATEDFATTIGLGREGIGKGTRRERKLRKPQ